MAVTVAGIVAGAALVAAIPSLRHAVVDAVQGDTGAVRGDIDDLGAVPAALLALGLSIIHVIVWYPAEILDAAVGYVFGFGVGLPLMMACWLISGMVAYYVGRHAARPLLYRLVGEKRFLRLEAMVDRGGATVLLIARLVPIVPFSLMSMVAGATRVPTGRFLWTTVVGYTPITAYFTYLGSQLESFSAEDPIVWIGAGAVVLAIFGVRYLIPRRLREGA